MPQNLNKEPIRLEVLGRIPSKKNSRNVFVRGGKLFNIPSKKYKEWHDKCSGQLITRIPAEPLNIVECVELSFYAPDKRKADLTNKAESIMDLLVDNKILEDDNWYNVGKIILNFVEVDKLNPRCKISIYLKENTNEQQ